MRRQTSSPVSELRQNAGGTSGALSESSIDERSAFPQRTLSLDSNFAWSRIFHSGTAGSGGKAESRPDLEAAILLRQRLQRFLVTQVLLSNLVRHPCRAHACAYNRPCGSCWAEGPSWARPGRPPFSVRAPHPLGPGPPSPCLTRLCRRLWCTSPASWG